jgi:hypothetical protein
MKIKKVGTEYGQKKNICAKTKSKIVFYGESSKIGEKYVVKKHLFYYIQCIEPF